VSRSGLLAGRRGGVALPAVLVALLGAAVWATVGRLSPSAPERTGSVTRLGPNDGEPVAGYVQRTRAVLAGRVEAEPAYALVAFGRYLRPAAVPALLGRADVVEQLVRVPLRRVQTEVILLPARTPTETDGLMVAAARRLLVKASGNDAEDRVAAAVDAAQARALAAGCACVLAAVVHGPPAELRVLAARPGVRAVEVAPAGEPLSRLAFVPLLPEQATRVGPPPDDGAAALVTPAPTPTKPPRPSSSSSSSPGLSGSPR